MRPTEIADIATILELDYSPFYELRIIDGPGEYKTRNGRRVTIHNIVLPPQYTSGCMCFPAKGSIWRRVTAMGLNPEYGIWRLDGRYRAVGDHPLDIVSRWSAN